MKKAALTVTLAALAALWLVAFSSPAAGAGPGGAYASALSLNITGSQEADEITLTLDSAQNQYVITSTHPINAAPPCTSASTFEVRCPASQITSFQVFLLGGNDTMRVGPSVKAPATIRGGAGLDNLFGGGGSDRLLGASGRDRLVGANGQDVLNGGRGGDVLKGGKGRDVLKGGKGRDVLRGGPGRDVEKQ